MDQPQVVLNMVDYPTLRDKGVMRLDRIRADVYKLYILQFSQQTGDAVDHQELPMNRAGAEALAKGLEQENERLLALIEKNKAACANLRGALVADMDALDAAAVKAAVPAAAAKA